MIKLAILFLISFLLSLFLTPLARRIALRFGVVDQPDKKRKTHKQATPLLGGLAVFIAFFLPVFLILKDLVAGDLNYQQWVGFFAGGFILIIGGFLDDKYDLTPEKQFIVPLLAIIAVLLGGVEIEKITNPLGGYIFLDKFFLSEILIGAWLLIMMYTTKLLDGVDGLVSGIGSIGGFIIFLFTITTRYYQPDIALASLIFAGASLGFLVFNWHPAKIFLGEGGSLLIGFILGVLAIISGGKIAIALLVLGLPLLDFIWTIIRRLARGKNPFHSADREHLHHRLLATGLSPQKTVLIFYAFSAFFGLAGLFLQSTGKLLAVLALVVIMFFLVIFLSKKIKASN